VVAVKSAKQWGVSSPIEPLLKKCKKITGNLLREKIKTATSFIVANIANTNVENMTERLTNVMFE